MPGWLVSHQGGENQQQAQKPVSIPAGTPGFHQCGKRLLRLAIFGLVHPKRSNLTTENAAPQSRNRMKEDRSMAAQNHAKKRRDLCLKKHRGRGCMILCCHDSVSHLRLHEESSQLANNLDYCREPQSCQAATGLREAFGMRGACS